LQETRLAISVNDMREIEFNKSGFCEIISGFKRKEYSFQSFDEKNIHGKSVILRHDIDFSLEWAVEQAALNKVLGVSATFFILLTTEHYNLASVVGRQAVHAIRSYDQHLGLHFDASAYGSNADMEAKIATELDILRSLFGEPITAISFHRPVKDLLQIEGRICGLPHAYQKEFFKDMDYCSDSRGNFFHGTPHQRDSFLNNKPMQLLTHPIWWMRDVALKPLEVLLAFENYRNGILRASIGQNSIPFNDYLREQKID
jgi:hypothetical protein